MKVEKSENFQNKRGSKGYKWSSLNAQGTGNPLSHPLLGLGELHFPIIGPQGNKNWPPSMKVKKLENFQNKRGLMGCKRPSLNAPGTGNPLSHPILELYELSFLHIGPLG